MKPRRTAQRKGKGRPYFSHGIGELEKLYSASLNDRYILQHLSEELAKRKAKRAVELEALVGQRLEKLKDRVSTSTGDRGKNESNAPIHPDSVQGQLFPDAVEDTVPAPDDREKPKVLTLIRGPGTPELPDAWQRPKKYDLSLSHVKDADLPDRYAAALNALIAEVKRTGSGQKRYTVDHGIISESTGGEHVYSFPFSDEAELFEDAKIELQVEGRRIEGSIVSISAGRLLIATKENRGRHIAQAVILVDTTALLEALVEKIEQVKQGTTDLNRELADAVVGRKPEPAPMAPIAPGSPERLNDAQFAAYSKALSAAVTWIWGPPGCGKTMTLGEVVKAAFEADRRVLVSSNTNKAVDQVLFHVCEALGKDHRAMDQGRIVRLGRLVDKKLKEEYSGYVTLDGIVDRLTKDLQDRRGSVQEELGSIEVKLKAHRGILALFAELDRAEQLVSAQRESSKKLNSEEQHARRELSRIQARCQQLEIDLHRPKNLFSRIFGRSEESIQEDIRQNEAARFTVEGRAAKGREDLRAADARLNECVADRDRKRDLLGGKDRTIVEEKADKAKDRGDALIAELSEIDSRIASIRDSVLKEALVMGSTCTRAYLSMSSIGRFDMVIIDEASMVLQPAAWITAGLSRGRVVICGDYRQIPPIVPSDQEAILQILGDDLFAAARVKDDHTRLVQLTDQYRMRPEICDLISARMYAKRLRTALDVNHRELSLPPAPFDKALTIIDTSDLWPFESQDAFFSRFNLLHALLVRNLVWHLVRTGAIEQMTDFGICTPYAAQSRVIRKVLEGEDHLAGFTVGTVHRMQGDEWRMILLEIPESHGGAWHLGQFIQGLPPDYPGARLLNVGVSRARDQLMIMANLTYLDERLPSGSLLRSILFDMQEGGTVVPGREVLRLRPIESDLKGLIGHMPLAKITEEVGIFDEKDFSQALEIDIRDAKESVVIFSGYVTESRVGKLGDLLRVKVQEGVKVRCVTRPPDRNGSIPLDQGKAALDMLERIGVTVDCRATIHQKVCLIDGRIVWLGSLNALSHSGASDEMMTRTVNEGYANAVAAHMSKLKISADKAVREMASPENPRCPDCKSRTVFANGRFGPYYYCEAKCGWKKNQRSLITHNWQTRAVRT